LKEEEKKKPKGLFQTVGKTILWPDEPDPSYSTHSKVWW